MGNTQKRLIPPVGISDFSEIISGNYYFVDKTSFISELIDDRAYAILLARPSQFGRTINTSMLRYFFDCNKIGGRNPEENRKLFEGLSVYQDSQAMREQGKYPVTYMSFKDLPSDSWEEFSEKFKSKLVNLVKDFYYLYDSKELSEWSKYYFEKILGSDEADKEPYWLNTALRDLTQLLHRHHRTSVIVLIDDYDAPYKKAYENGYGKEMAFFTENFLGAALKDNSSLHMGCLIGTERIGYGDSVRGGLNNLFYNTISDIHFHDSFGFTQQEIEDLAKYYGQEDKIPEIKDLRGGKLFNDHKIYNPGSVMQYLANNCKAGS